MAAPVGAGVNPPAFVIAIVGAESTGKTTLAAALAKALDREDRRAVRVPEYLREFCDAHSRTPRRDEQMGIAAEQTRRIGAAAAQHSIVVADTTALMTAVYSDWVFGDASLYAAALRDHLHADLTLLTGLDAAWTADGLQRDGPQVREPIDAMLRRSLDAAGVGYSVVGGVGPARTAGALRAVEHALAARDAGPRDAPVGRALCERCGDPQCERRLLARRQG
ncbi:MAG: AAA family ATPase [Burkholderiaceae bacterium]